MIGTRTAFNSKTSSNEYICILMNGFYTLPEFNTVSFEKLFDSVNTDSIGMSYSRLFSTWFLFHSIMRASTWTSTARSISSLPSCRSRRSFKFDSRLFQKMQIQFVISCYIDWINKFFLSRSDSIWLKFLFESILLRIQLEIYFLIPVCDALCAFNFG